MSSQCSQTSRSLSMSRGSLRLCRCMAVPRPPRNNLNRVQRHQDAVESLTRDIQIKLSEIEQERMPDGSSWKHIVDKGIQDIQDVAARTGVAPRTQAPLSAYSDVWTFPICLVTYSTLLITWASVLAGMCTFLLPQRELCTSRGRHQVAACALSGINGQMTVVHVAIGTRRGLQSLLRRFLE